MGDRHMGYPALRKPRRPATDDDKGYDLVDDRLRVAVRTLVVAGHGPVDPKIALAGAGLEMHCERDALMRRVPHIEEAIRVQR